jgi:glycosyltransferase involved in cell wall biosynthesis
VYPSIDVLYWRHILTRQLRRIHRLIALSQSTASDLVTLCQVPRERITVIYPGHDPAFHVVPQDQVCAARARFGLPERYLIHVGNISLKKNLGTLIEAFLDFRARHGFDGKLLLAGADYYKGHDERLEQLIAQPNVRDALVLPGYIPQDLLVALLNGACAFLFPSLHEGFGIAVLEAMACGVPVIAHAAGAVREVVGDAGVIIESSTDIHSWSCAIKHLVADPSLRARLRRDSLARAQLFSAEQCARQTLHLYKSLSVS